MKRRAIRVEPLATWLDNDKAPTSTVVRHGDTICVTGAPPCRPGTAASTSRWTASLRS